MLKSLALLTTSALAAEKRSDTTCRAVAMQGGGAYGAFEAGALYGMYHAMENPGANFDYDVITGVSAGSINTLGVALFPKEQAEHSFQVMSDIWADLKQEDLFVNWKFFFGFIDLGPLGMLKGLLSESGVYNTAPFYKKATELYHEHGGKINRMISMSSVDTNSGTYVEFNETYKDPPQAAVASSSIPVIFPTSHFDDTYFTDGGVVYGVNVHAAINRCLEIVEHESQVVVDILMCSNGAHLAPYAEDKSVIGHYQRNDQLKSYHGAINDVYANRKAHPQAQWRYLVHPTASLGSMFDMLQPANATTWPMQMQGRKDGADAVLAGEGATFKPFDDWDASPELRKQYPRLPDYIKSLMPKSKAEPTKQPGLGVEKFMEEAREMVQEEILQPLIKEFIE